MARSEDLFVYLEENLVGTLVKKGTGAMSFSYDPSWLKQSEAIPISLSLGLERERYSGPEVYNFFDNLLPDSVDIRKKLATNVQAESDTPFDLLKAIGGDCVGALRITSSKDVKYSHKIMAENLSEARIAKIIKELKTSPLGIRSSDDDEAFRISVAGAQEKTALLFHEGQWKLPLGTTPTTHIFKPSMGILHNGIDLRTSVENEWLCLKLCEAFGLSVNHAEIHEFEDVRCLVVERFDRRWKTKNKLIRIPQEDMCQALGVPSHLKYEAEHREATGVRPGFKDILNLLNDSDERVNDRMQFLKANVIYWLLGAIDGHGKNFSVQMTSAGFKMTPFYDVLSVYPALKDKQIQQKQAKMAMAVGDKRHYRLFKIEPRHFFESAKKYGIPQKKLTQNLEEILKCADGLRDNISVPKDFPEKILTVIMEGVQEKIERLQRYLG
ncbi:MAG: type II toxin-antitoxin system HipA family toxin [Bdellovibrionaceae bacterium]|jgi:serine/threonine-protein kinase HipA|nr:type II toxin-antitoxin system HipA family toxin [Pseudobdellovibrionaceae bacterium]